MTKKSQHINQTATESENALKIDPNRDKKGRFVKGNKAGNRFKANGEQTAIARKAGVKSGEVKREKKTIRECLRSLLDERLPNGKTRREIVVEKLTHNTLENGTVKDLKTLQEVLGEELFGDVNENRVVFTFATEPTPETINENTDNDETERD